MNMGIRSLSGYFVVWLLVFADLWCRAPGFHVPLSPRKMQVQSGVIFKLITCSKCGGDDIRLCKPQPYRRRMTGQDSEVTKEHLSFITTPAASPVSAKKTSTLYNIPNILTVLRLLSVPLFMYTAFQNRRAASFFIFIASSLTDYLDGYLARRWKQESPFGAFLDPVADKLMVSTALVFILSTIPSELTALPIATIICREIAVSALREWMAQRNIHQVVKVGLLGKIKTALQMIATAVLLLAHKSMDTTDIFLPRVLGLSVAKLVIVGIALLYGAAFASVISGVQYFAAAVKALYLGSMNNNKQHQCCGDSTCSVCSIDSKCSKCVSPDKVV